jgi:hypothetical protein
MTIQNKATADDSISWGELAELTHETQVERFGFCTCEDGPKSFSDCPRKRSEIDDEVDAWVNTLKDGQDGHDGQALNLIHEIYSMNGEEATDGECLELMLEVLTEWKRYI